MTIVATTSLSSFRFMAAAVKWTLQYSLPWIDGVVPYPLILIMPNAKCDHFCAIASIHLGFDSITNDCTAFHLTRLMFRPFAKRRHKFVELHSLLFCAICVPALIVYSRVVSSLLGDRSSVCQILMQLGLPISILPNKLQIPHPSLQFCVAVLRCLTALFWWCHTSFCMLICFCHQNSLELSSKKIPFEYINLLVSESLSV